MHDSNRDSRAKRSRYGKANRSNSSDEKINSGVYKVGDWSLSKGSNAIKQFGKKAITNEKGELEFAVALATLNIRIQTGIDSITFCRAIADTGATVNCISWEFVRHNKLQTYKCRKNILGVSGPETISHRVIAHIRPWFDSDIAIPIEFLVLKDLNGVYPFNRIEASKEEIIHLGLADEKFDIPSPIHALLGVEVYASIIGSDIYMHKNGTAMIDFFWSYNFGKI